MITNKKPAYWITVKDAFMSFLVAEMDSYRQYKPNITRMPVIKTIGLTKSVAAGDIYASGIIYDTTSRTQGAEIALSAVALPDDILNEALGALVDGGFAYDNVGDVGKEFAFGYYLEESDGGFVYYWHPRCKLTASDESPETSTDSAPDPSRDYTIKVMPTAEGIWRIRYRTKSVTPAPLTPEQFFGVVRYTDNIQLCDVTIGDPESGSAYTATPVYVDSETPATPILSYQWKICATQDGEFEDIDGENTASYTPDSDDVGKYIKCFVTASGSAIGMAESVAKVVGA